MAQKKSRSEGIIHPILLELREQFNRKISIFSGTEFDVDASQGLSGYCDYLISRSPQQSFITASVAVAVEAKKGDLNLGLGQCAATMVAAQRFNVEQILGILFAMLEQHGTRDRPPHRTRRFSKPPRSRARLLPAPRN